MPFPGMPGKDPDRSSTVSNLSATSTSSKTLPTTPKNKNDVNIKRVAVTMLEQQGKEGQLLQFDQKRPLDEIVKDICEKWSLPDPGNYALRFNDTTLKVYITEKNRKDIINGQMLHLTPSAERTASMIKSALTGSNLNDKNLALRQLSLLSSDITLAEEFIKLQGHLIVIEILTSGMVKGDLLSYALKSFASLMEHSILSWEILEPEFIKRVADCVIVTEHHLDTACLQSALDILQSVVLHCTHRQNVVEQVLTPANLIPHLKSSSVDVQKNTIALINALFTRADDEKKKKFAEVLQSKSMRNIILNNVILGQTVGAGMAHELYVLQNLLLNLNEDRMKTPADAHDPANIKRIEELRRIAFDMDADPYNNNIRKSQNATEDYKKLGFEKADYPVEDFTCAPPGTLALDAMLYFANHHRENFVKVVMENATRVDGHVCPFVQASKRLTEILCDVLHIGDQPSENGETYYEMLFTHDKPFEEFFTICIQLLNKTWREMKATTQDFAKVLEVVREQITRELDKLPSTFGKFRDKLNALTYAEISKIRENERREREDQGAQLKPIIELRSQILPEIRELIQQQRLNYLTAGTRFAKYTQGGKVRDKFWFWRLSPNHKALHYGDCGESDTKSLDQLPNKLKVQDIVKLVTGRECPHVSTKERGRTKQVTSFNVAFCLKLDPETDPFCFLASSDSEFDLWTDGLNHLLGNEMTSPQVKKDEDILVAMEIKMRMLDTEGVDIPAEAPPIPPPPSNYNFAYLNLDPR